MGLLRDSRAIKKLKAVRRAEFRLKQTFERIDFEEDVLLPEVEAMLAGRPVLGLTEGTTFDLVVDANPDQTAQPGATRRAARATRKH